MAAPTDPLDASRVSPAVSQGESSSITWEPAWGCHNTTCTWGACRAITQTPDAGAPQPLPPHAQPRCRR